MVARPDPSGTLPQRPDTATFPRLDAFPDTIYVRCPNQRAAETLAGDPGDWTDSDRPWRHYGATQQNEHGVRIATRPSDPRWTPFLVVFTGEALESIRRTAHIRDPMKQLALACDAAAFLGATCLRFDMALTGELALQAHDVRQALLAGSFQTCLDIDLSYQTGPAFQAKNDGLYIGDRTSRGSGFFRVYNKLRQLLEQGKADADSFPWTSYTRIEIECKQRQADEYWCLWRRLHRNNSRSADPELVQWAMSIWFSRANSRKRWRFRLLRTPAAADQSRTLVHTDPRWTELFGQRRSDIALPERAHGITARQQDQQDAIDVLARTIHSAAKGIAIVNHLDLGLHRTILHLASNAWDTLAHGHRHRLESDDVTIRDQLLERLQALTRSKTR